MNIKQTIKKILIFLVIGLTISSAQAKELLIDNQSGKTVFCNITIRVITHGYQLVDTISTSLEIPNGQQIYTWSAEKPSISEIIITNKRGIEYYNSSNIYITATGQSDRKIKLIKPKKNGKRFIEYFKNNDIARTVQNENKLEHFKRVLSSSQVPSPYEENDLEEIKHILAQRLNQTIEQNQAIKNSFMHTL